MTSRDISGNRELVEKYPFLAIKDGDAEHSWYDSIPDGWRKAFGPQMIKELNDLLLLASERDGIDWTQKYKIDDVKEKWAICIGTLLCQAAYMMSTLCGRRNTRPSLTTPASNVEPRQTGILPAGSSPFARNAPKSMD